MHEFKTANQKELIFKNRQALHGDVIIEKIDKLPKDFKKLDAVKDNCLAYGEVTGHSHKLFRMTDETTHVSMPWILKQTPEGIKFLHVDEPTCLRHQEHDPRVIPAGDYKISIQREYSPYEKLARNVAD